jgi:hypothetical protein
MSVICLCQRVSLSSPARRRLLAHDAWSQKGTSTGVSCLLDRTISHPLIVESASGLSTSQITKSRVVFKSQYPLICDGAQAHRDRAGRVCLRSPLDFIWFPRKKQVLTPDTT